jgi:predicted GNAT family acetyltransferase
VSDSSATTDPDATDDLTWADKPDARRWEVKRGDEVIAFADYRTDAETITFTHTVVDPEYEGRGIGSRLAARILDDAVERGLRIVPRCPFIRTYIERHDKYADSVDMPPPES